LRAIGLTRPGEAEEGYRRMLDPASWLPYPDAAATLERLRDKGIPVAVVSNIAFDVRRMFDRHGITGLVDEFVLSYEVGSIKPDEKIFRVAGERLGVELADTLMIGDSAEADGAAAALGARVGIVPALPTTERPGALLAVLDQHGL
jgi:HAD superfamily hydrolase (TIGR01509 family)